MAILRYFPSSGSPTIWPLHKPVVTIGRALGNDVHVADATMHNHHAQIVFNGRDFQLEEVDRGAAITINGKKKRRGRLVNGDRIVLGEALSTECLPIQGGASGANMSAGTKDSISATMRDGGRPMARILL